MTAQPDENPRPDETQPDPDPQPDAPDAPVEPEAPVEPADAPDAPALAQVIELHTERGSLTLRPDQKALDPEQHAALKAINIDTQADPQVIPHLRAFVHMCQVKGLDPWAREAYLIGRGQGANRKYTMQTGIDGYRKMAAATGRFIRVKEVLWTGQDDDDRTYRAVDDGKGGVIMRRVWYDQWPASRGYPGAAKVTIEHYDVAGNVVETDAVADWGMYAPFVDEWEWDPAQRGKKVYKYNEDGTKKQTLNDMWAKGYAHMLAKCAEALADRKAFPAVMSGVYTHEEMHHADQQERERLAAEQRAARTQAYVAATTGRSQPQAVSTGPLSAPGRVAAAETSAPMPVGEDVAEVVQQVAQASAQSTAPSDAPEAAEDPAQRAVWLLDELTYQAGVLGHTVSKVAARPMRALKKNPEDFTADELLPLVAGLRPMVVARLRQDGAPADEVEAYAALGPTDVVNLPEYLAGITVDGEAEDDEAGPDPADDPRLDADPAEPHEPVLSGGLCEVCGEEPDYVLHTEADTP
jgi:hypothetical protein